MPAMPTSVLPHAGMRMLLRQDILQEERRSRRMLELKVNKLATAEAANCQDGDHHCGIDDGSG